MLEVEPTAQSSHAATRSDQNGNEAVAGAASEAFAKWLHHRYDLIDLPLAEAYRFTVCHLI